MINWGGTTPTANGVWHQQSGHHTYVFADVDGNADTAELVIKLTGRHELSNTDFLGVISNQPPVTTDDAAVTDEDTVVAGTVVDNTTDADDDVATELVYSVVGAIPAGLTFNADGTYSFDPGGLFEALDIGDSAQVTFDYQANDGAADSNVSKVTITINGVNDAPVITSGASGGEAENSATTNVVYTASASDPDAGDPLSFSLSGTDAAHFNIDENTGAVTFKVSPDFEAPADVGGDNDYNITVTTTDSGGLTGSKDVAITVTNVIEPLFTENADTVNFNTLLAGDYIATTQYDALGGGDIVTLPADAARAEAAGYDPVRTFQGGNGNDIITGGGLNDIIDGGNHDDIISGGAGDDQLSGGNGDDTLSGGEGDDALTGGNGSDTASYADAGGGVSVNLGVITVQAVGGGQGADTLTGIENLTGSNFDDVLTGDGNANVLEGLGGNDILNGGAGNDTYRFGLADGFDTINEVGGGGTDTIVIVANGAALSSLSFARSGASDLVIQFNGQQVTVLGHFAGNTVEFIRFEGGASFQGYDLGSGPYGLLTSPGGGIGNEVISGQNIPDSAETLTGSGGSDLIFGNAGNDTIGNAVTETGDDLLVGGAGNNNVLGGISGGPGNDVLLGGAGNDELNGGDDDDTLFGGPGDDTLNGGAGIDTAAYGDATSGVTVNLGVAGSQAVGGGLGSDTLTGIENLSGSNFNDTLTGDGAANVLQGLGGDDTLNGGAGNDTLVGGAGNDTLTGGSGSDVFKFSFSPGLPVTSGDGFDSIVDFTWGGDQLEFNGLGAGFTLAQFQAAFKLEEVNVGGDAGLADTKLSLMDDSWSATLFDVSGHTLEEFHATSVFS